MSVYLPNQHDSGVKYTVASTLLTVLTNIIVTTLIAIRLLRARRNLAKLLPSADVRVYTGVIAILIESAAPLTIFGTINGAIALTKMGGTMSRNSGGIITCGLLSEGLFFSFCVSWLVESFPSMLIC